MFIGWHYQTLPEICRKDFWEEVSKNVELDYYGFDNLTFKNNLNNELNVLHDHIKKSSPNHIVFGERLLRLLRFNFSLKTDIPISIIIDDWHFLLETGDFFNVKKYKDEHLKMEPKVKEFLNKHNVNKVFSRCYKPIPRLEKMFGKKINFMPWAVNYKKFAKFHREEKIYDVLSIGTGIKTHFCLYPTRHYYATHMPTDINSHIPNNPVNDDDYRRILSKTKIFLFGLGKRLGPIAKCIEGMSSSALIMHDGTWDDKILGYNDEINYIKVNRDNFRGKIHYYLKNNDKRNEIVINANKLIKDRHTIQSRVKEFIEELKNGR